MLPSLLVCIYASRLAPPPTEWALPACNACRYGNFMQKGIELAKEAVEADNKQDWSRVGAGTLLGCLLASFFLCMHPAGPRNA